MRRHALLILCLWTIIPGLTTGCASMTHRDSAEPAHAAFFGHLAALEGQSFSGRTLFMSEPDEAMMNGTLTMHIAKVEPKLMHVRFLVDDDASRTWILTLSDDSLHLRHRHLYPDGTPHEVTNYGGWAEADGTPLQQRFPADDVTRTLLPQASTNVWMMAFDPDRNVFIYDLERHGRPRYRAEFDLTSPR